MSEFAWRVATQGYVWQPDTDDEFGHPERYLEPVVWEFRQYNPFAEPALFRTFVDTEMTEEAMLAFANRYGNLGCVHVDWFDDPPEPPDELETRRERREWRLEELFKRRLRDPLSRWEEAHSQLKHAVGVWDRVRMGRAKSHDSDWLEAEMDEQINSNGVELLLVCDQQVPSGFRIDYAPKNLLGALWIQLALAIADNKDFRQCSACWRWFEISSSHYRTSRKHCSEACKSRAYRERRAQAARMAKSGKSECEIADALDTDPQTVTKWLAGKKR